MTVTLLRAPESPAIPVALADAAAFISEWLAQPADHARYRACLTPPSPYARYCDAARDAGKLAVNPHVFRLLVARVKD
jgi:hypothetical protein